MASSLGQELVRMASSGAVYVKFACHIQMQAYSDQKVHDTTLNSIILTHVKEFFPLIL